MATTYAQLAGNAFGPSEVADAAATIGQHTASTFDVAGGGAHAGWTLRFHAATGNTFEYNAVTNEPILGSGDDLIGSVDLLNGSTVVATFTTLSGGGDERFLDEWWTTYKAGGAKTGATDAFHGLFGSTNETGDGNSNALETFGTGVTLNGGSGGSDRYIVDWSNSTIIDGAGNGTVYVNALPGSKNWNMGDGTNTLVSNIFKFDAHVAGGDPIINLDVFTLGTAAHQFDLDAPFVPLNAVFNGNAPTDIAFLRIDDPTYNASAWNVTNYPGKFFLDAVGASGAVTLKGPNAPTTFLGDGDGGGRFTGGSANDTANFGGGTFNFFDGAGGTDTIILGGTPDSHIVTRTGPNAFHILEPNGTGIDVVNVENWLSANGSGTLAAAAGPANLPPTIFSVNGGTPTVPLAVEIPRFAGYKIGSVTDDQTAKSALKLVSAKLSDGSPLPAGVSVSKFDDGSISVFVDFPKYPGGAQELHIKVTVADGGGLQSSAVLPVFIDHAPDLTPPTKPVSYQEGHNPGIDLFRFAADKDIPLAMPSEGSTASDAVGHGSAQLTSPPDIAHQHLAFSIVGGADKGDFKLTSAGLLKFKKTPDFDHPKDANHDNLYKVKISVSDGFLTDEATIKVKVTQHHSARMEPSTSAQDEAPTLHAGHHHEGDWLLA